MVRTTKARQALLAEAGYAMQAYQRSTQAFDDAVGRALGVNPTDLRALDWLVDGPKSAGQLSVGTGLSTAATTDLIDRLSQKGFVRRVPDPVDRRRVLVEMTEEGSTRVGRYYGPLVEEGSELLADVNDDQLASMRDWLVAARRLTDRHRQRLEERSDPSL
jgi:DNA-binding MarR family transcriptional regulator